MRILFLDDMKIRQESFEMQIIVHLDDVHVEDWRAWNGEQALKRLEERDYDVMFLDHDLGDDQYSEHRDGVRVVSKALSGTEVAEAIALLPVERLPKLVVIHSWNRYGADRMADILHRAGVKVLQIMFSDDLLKNALPFFPK